MKSKLSFEVFLVILATGLFAAGLCFVSPSLWEGVDYVTIWQPVFQFLTDAVRAGHIPLWNPYVHLGRPYLADMPNMTFYPPIYLVCLGQQTGVFLLVWLHCLLGAFGMLRLAGALGAGRWQGCFMATCFLASGPLMAHWATGQLPYCWASCYLPWLFCCAVRTEEPWQSRRIALHAALLALQLLCIPQVFWFTAVGQAVFIIARAVRRPLRQAVGDAWHGLWQFGAACLWAAALLAVALLPFMELIGQSNRHANSPEFVTSYNLLWSQLGYLFGPLNSGVAWEMNIFAGTILVLLGLAGLSRVRERNTRGLLGVLGIALLISVGDQSPLFGLFYKWLPGFASFRFHGRAALLVVLVLICAAGTWLSLPHLRLRASWNRICRIPLRYVLIALALLQAVDSLQGAWMIKRVLTASAFCTLGVPLERSYAQTLVTELRTASLLEPFQPPPRVFVTPSLVPRNAGMIYRYSNFDADWPPFLQRPWDYLHAILRIPEGVDKGSLSPEVYRHGPLPYPDTGLAAGFDPRTGKLLLATNPAPRAFLVYAAEVADYASILSRLARGYEVHRAALLEQPLAVPLPPQGSLPGTPALIRRFEPDSLLIDVDAKAPALLVLAETWYPGWRADIDGQTCECVSANLWMRAVPVPAGRHQVRVYFRQDRLLAGLLISLAGAGLLLVALARPKSREPRVFAGQEAFPTVALPPAGAGSNQEQIPLPSTACAGAWAQYARPICALIAGALVVWLIAEMELRRVRSFHSMQLNVDTSAHYQKAMSFTVRHKTALAVAQYLELLRLKPDSAEALNQLAWIRASSEQAEFRDGADAVRLAQRACELTGYRTALYVGTLAAAYAEAGRFDEAVATAATAHDLALAAGQNELAAGNLRLMNLYKAHKPVWQAGRPGGSDREGAGANRPQQ